LALLTVKILKRRARQRELKANLEIGEMKASRRNAFDESLLNAESGRRCHTLKTPAPAYYATAYSPNY
jgi:hypothetical protein